MQPLPNNSTQRSQASGELCPAMYGHTDQQKYESGLRTCRNAIVLRQGVSTNRPGLGFVGTAFRRTEQVRLFKFIFSMSQARLLVFSPQLIEVVINGAFTGVQVETPYAEADLFDLKISQSADVVTIVHPSYPPAELQRHSDADWEYVITDFEPQIDPPTNVLVDGVPIAEGQVWQYVVTAVAADTYEESLPSAPGVILVDAAVDQSTQPHEITWDAVAGAVQYNIYLSIGLGTYGLVGTSVGLAFEQAGIVPDITTAPPTNPGLFAKADDYPAVTGYYQQRKVYAQSNKNPGRTWASRSGRYNNFTISSPTQEDDAVTFDLITGMVDRVQSIIDLGKMLIGTEGSEFIVEGDANGILTPTAINSRVGSYNGVNKLPAIKVDNTVLYVQALGTVVRKLTANIMYGYYTFQGEDLTLMASHLFEGYTLMDWDWAQIPNYVVWAVRSDGTLLGCTFIPEQQLLAWHRHDTENGFFESVACIPENGEHAVYVVVRRMINGEQVRYIERFTSRLIKDSVRDPKFMDSFLTYDGTNTSACTITLSGGGPDTPARPYIPSGSSLDVPGDLRVAEDGIDLRITEDGDNRITEDTLIPGPLPALPALSGWGSDVVLTLTCSCPQFTALDIGGQYPVTGPDGTVIRMSIIGITSPTSALGTPDKSVPVSMQNVPLSVWARAVKIVGNLAHLEGQNVSVFADGGVVANPNNDEYDILTVTGGQLTLDKPYAVICIGLPYLSDLQTLDIDMPHGASAKPQRMNVTAVGLMVDATRGVWIGGHEPDDIIDGLVEMKLRDTQAMGLDDGQPITPVTKYIEQNIESEWNSNGRVFIRQVDPVPMTVLSITALGYVPAGA